ncbi:hypothetical protein D3C72_1052770 [compost metagenome]
MQRAVNDGDGGRNRTLIADDLFDAFGHLDVAGIGHAMGDDGRFKRHDRRAALLGCGDFLRIDDGQERGDGAGHGICSSFQKRVHASISAWGTSPNMASTLSFDSSCEVAKGDCTVMAAAAAPCRKASAIVFPSAMAAR